MDKTNPSNPSQNVQFQIRHIPLKRIFDLLFSFICLVLGAPLFLLIGALIYFTSPGKILYAQLRLGRGGVPFRCYKFRTMHPDADKRLQDLLTAHPELRKEWEETFKLKQDPRITPIGAFLRKTSLDELPQFWNVLKGDLSIVGPRPIVKEEAEKFFREKISKILSVRPGVTGLWQVSGRSNISCYYTRIALDEFYVDNQSFLFDLRLIAKTIPAILFSKGAY